jgi:cathepsin B
MLRLFIVATLLALACAANFNIGQYDHMNPIADMKKPAINENIIKKVNAAKTTWKAGFNSRFDSVSLGSAKKLLGWKPNPALAYKYENRVSPKVSSLPDNFSSATQWPKCTTIGTIYNQADCGSCWAFGCVESASDRMCIQSSFQKNYLLSFMEEVCCDPNDGGCEGGDPMSAWGNIAEAGLVSDECYPYTIPTCPPAQQPCLNFVNTPNCLTQCNTTNATTWSPLNFQQPYSVDSSETAIRSEIMTNGPVEACFSVYEDFLSYKTGVYQYQTGDFLGGHCIKIIGWGIENGTPYWLCNNSWTTYWGDDGQFKILRGQDECGIEDQVVAAML